MQAQKSVSASSLPPYRRILVKLSGEALMGDREFGLNPPVVARMAEELAVVREMGIEVAVVVGGGNIFRGLSAAADGMSRPTADYMGMLATVMNALALQSACERFDIDARVMSAIPMPTVCEEYAQARARHHLSRGRIVIFAAGTGNPFFTTDTAATLRALETECEALFKGTQVDGVYDRDPRNDPSAKRYETITFQEVLEKNLKVMDAAAIALARDNKLPVAVFSLQGTGSIAAAVRGEGKRTLVTAS